MKGGERRRVAVKGAVAADDMQRQRQATSTVEMRRKPRERHAVADSPRRIVHVANGVEDVRRLCHVLAPVPAGVPAMATAVPQ